MMVLRVRSQMASKLLDSRREQRNLDFRRAAIVCDSSVVSDNASLASGLKGHQVSYSFPFVLLELKITDHRSGVKRTGAITLGSDRSRDTPLF
jgi:hypothetical protein